VTAAGQPSRRLFFALWPADAVRHALAAAFGAAVAAGGGRAVPPAHLHLTLEFLGPVAGDRLAELVAIGGHVALAAEPLVLDRLEWWRRAATLVVAPSTPGAGLLAVQAELRRALGGSGFRVDSRPFRPHVTLARKVVAAPAAAPGAVVWPVEELALVASEPAAGGSRYTRLARWSGAATQAEFGAR
jgi:RNA 2',3'-cyclic 3'-phosphodiesterase